MLNNYNDVEINGDQESAGVKRYRLEPLNYGELVDRTIRIFRDNFGSLLPMTFFIYIPFIISTILLFVVRIAARPSLTTVNLMSYTNNFISALCTFVLIARVTTMVTEIYNGNPVDANVIKAKSSGFYWRILKTGLLFGFGVAALIFITFVCSYLFFVMLSVTLKAFGLIIALVISVGMIVITAWWSFSNSLAIYLPTLEGISGKEALKRSSQLFYSNRESILKMIFIPIIIQILMFLVFLTPTVLMVVLLKVASQHSLLVTGFITFVMLTLTVLLNSLPMIAMTVVYYDIRIRTEGFDIEREMDQQAVV